MKLYYTIFIYIKLKLNYIDKYDIIKYINIMQNLPLDIHNYIFENYLKNIDDSYNIVQLNHYFHDLCIDIYKILLYNFNMHKSLTETAWFM